MKFKKITAVLSACAVVLYGILGTLPGSMASGRSIMAASESGWKDAYADYLRELYHNNSDTKFMLVYVDDDTIPELVYAEGYSRVTPAQMVSYDNGNIIKFDYGNVYGAFYYQKGKNLILEQNIGGGAVFYTIHSIINGKLETKISFEGFFDDAPENYKNTFYVNQTKVSKTEYMHQCSLYHLYPNNSDYPKFHDSTWDSVSYDSGMERITEETIKNYVGPASGSSGTCGENVTWSLDESTGVLTISGTGEMEDFSSENAAPWNKEKIRSVVIENGVTSIGDGAFYGCRSLPSVTIPDSVTNIGSAAFYDCQDMTSVNIPDGVTNIEYQTFGECYSLSSIAIPDSVTNIGGFAFYWCPKLTSVTVPASVNCIGCGAFDYCFGLQEITILNPRCEIDDNAYTISNTPESDYYSGIIRGYENSTAQAYAEKYDRTFASLGNADGQPGPSGTCGENVTWSLDVSTGVLTISGTGKMEDFPSNDATPWDRKKIRSVVIENGVTSIGNHAFYDCSSLTAITIPDSVTSFGDWAFSFCKNLTSITIPDSVTSFGERAFYYCTSLTEITIPEGVTSIGDDAFFHCERLTDITIPDSVTSFGEQAFCHCENLTGITIPDSVTSIGQGAFYSCTNLTDITIPDSVTTIGYDAFYGCTSLTDIIIPDSVTSIGQGTFYDTPWLTARREENPLVVVNGILIDGETCSGAVVIPDGVTSIGDKAFFFCENLTGITIPDSVTSIGNLAFYGCRSLTEFTILNPDCTIYPSDTTISSGLNDSNDVVYSGTIRGYDNSTAQRHAERYGYTFASLGDAPIEETPAVGDVNGDKSVDASDAADLLIALANIGAGADSGLTEEQTAAADADGSGTPDAGDAAVILQYAAYLGSGGMGTLTEFLNQ